jgi:predicted RNase H-like HicB family nuclease
MQRQFDVVIERDEDGYLRRLGPSASWMSYPGASLDEITERIREVIELCLEVERVPEQTLEFIGLQRITVAA